MTYRPEACGCRIIVDEASETYALMIAYCPTHAGVGVPHACGDEPQVMGDLERSIAGFVQACERYLAAQEKRLDPDFVVIELLCDAIRLARAYDALRRKG